MDIDKNIHVLIVDDRRTMLRIIRNMLNQAGLINIDEAFDGEMALQMLRSQHYGIVISDWNMEPMNGLQLLTEVRTDPTLQSTPFIMVTAASSTQSVTSAKEAGVTDYIIKPFSKDVLLQKIHHSIRVVMTHMDSAIGPNAVSSE